MRKIIGHAVERVNIFDDTRHFEWIVFSDKKSAQDAADEMNKKLNDEFSKKRRLCGLTQGPPHYFEVSDVIIEILD